MRLRERIHRERIHRDEKTRSERQNALFEAFGVLENPFPAAGQPVGHPHLETNVDEKIIVCIQQFEDNHDSQVLVIEGTQGVGKTNLLNYYQQELEDLYQDDKTFYIIRYYSDPEPGFDAIIRRIFLELGEIHLEKIAKKLNELKDDESFKIINIAKNHEIHMVLHALRKSVEKGQQEVDEITKLAMEWLLGLRLLKNHIDKLGIKFRLDTVESKNQALRDIVYVSVRLNLLGGIFLLLDELEKQDDSVSKTQVIRFLSAIRALVDSLPTHLFLMAALTTEARRRYFKMLPAFAGRLQNVLTLLPLQDDTEALALYELYLNNARKKAESDEKVKELRAGKDGIFEKKELANIFKDLKDKSGIMGIKGVIHRDFLNELHNRTQAKFQRLLES
ncbi:MAG TPA: P-loop NTPase fold protein [Thermodesulfovibrionia bacterium]|nr:P-loop NTPase fold protein [Thermodesulfovibrionia bacterium]